MSLSVSTHIFPRYPDFGAGRLTKLRAQAVSREACAEVGRRLDVVERLRAAAPEGVGKNAEVLVESDRILASVCEAIIGAAYLTFGFERVAPAIVEAFSDQIEDALENPVDFKSLLQEQLARRSRARLLPHRRGAGPPHDRASSRWRRSTARRSGAARARPRRAPSRKLRRSRSRRSGEEPG